MAALAIAHLASLPPLTSCHSSRPVSPLYNRHYPVSSTSSKLFLQFGIVPRASSSSASSLITQVLEHSDCHHCELQQPVQYSTGLLLGDVSFLPKALLTTAAALGFVLLDCQEAWAIDGAFGILEGRSLSLVHPIIMGSLFLYTLYAGYLGWQWRRVRTIQDEINQLKKDVAPKEEGAPPSPAEIKIKELTEVRKELLKGGFRDRHWNAGSILLGFGVFEAVGGCLNTWFRTGKLFPGPHLFAGAGITVLWALAASLVPAMQKGDETARSLHIALNAVNVALFLWQIPTGWDIVLKVLEFTSWP